MRRAGCAEDATAATAMMSSPHFGKRRSTVAALCCGAIRKPVCTRAGSGAAARPRTSGPLAGRGQGGVPRHVGRRRLLVQQDSRPEHAWRRRQQLVQVKQYRAQAFIRQNCVVAEQLDSKLLASLHRAPLLGSGQRKDHALAPRWACSPTAHGSPKFCRAVYVVLPGVYQPHNCIARVWGMVWRRREAATPHPDQQRACPNRPRPPLLQERTQRLPLLLVATGNFVTPGAHTSRQSMLGH